MPGAYFHKDGATLEGLMLYEVLVQGILCHILKVDLDGGNDIQSIGRFQLSFAIVGDPFIIINPAHDLLAIGTFKKIIISPFKAYEEVFFLVLITNGTPGQFIERHLPPGLLVHDQASAVFAPVQDWEGP